MKPLKIQQKNLESNIRDQAREETFYFQWSTLDLSGKNNLVTVYPRKPGCNINLRIISILRKFFVLHNKGYCKLLVTADALQFYIKLL